MSLWTVLLVALLGGAGAACRFVVDGVLRTRWSRRLPVATVVVNVSGSLVLGVLAAALAAGALAPSAYTAAAVGFCGGYTTFSTAMVETVRLAQEGDHGRAVANALGTLGLTVGAVALGAALTWLVLG